MVKVLPRQIQCRSGLEALGYSRSGASALVGNFCMESGASLPTAFRTKNLDHGSNGLAQWRLGRLTKLKAFVQSLKPELVQQARATGRNVDDLLWPWYGRMDFQVRFVAKELAEDYPALDMKLRKGGDVAALAADVCWQYERPSKLLSHISDRIAYAQAVAADKTEGPALTATPPVTVVDHLHAEATKHDNSATGGFIVAGGGVLGALGLFMSNFVHAIPTWEWVVIALLGALVILIILGAISANHAAANLRQAALGATPVPAPPPDPKSYEQPVLIPPKGGGLGPLAQAMADDKAFDDAVQAEVNRQLALISARGATMGQTAVVKDTTTGETIAAVATGPGAAVEVKGA